MVFAYFHKELFPHPHLPTHPSDCQLLLWSCPFKQTSSQLPGLFNSESGLIFTSNCAVTLTFAGSPVAGSMNMWEPTALDPLQCLTHDSAHSILNSCWYQGTQSFQGNGWHSDSHLVQVLHYGYTGLPDLGSHCCSCAHILIYKCPTSSGSISNSQRFFSFHVSWSVSCLDTRASALLRQP